MDAYNAEIMTMRIMCEKPQTFLLLFFLLAAIFRSAKHSWTDWHHLDPCSPLLRLIKHLVYNNTLKVSPLPIKGSLSNDSFQHSILGSDNVSKHFLSLSFTDPLSTIHRKRQRKKTSVITSRVNQPIYPECLIIIASISVVVS